MALHVAALAATLTFAAAAARALAQHRGAPDRAQPAAPAPAAPAAVPVSQETR